MLSEAQRFWDAIVGKVRQVAQETSQNAFRCERYEVTTAPNGSKMGVTLPLGTKEIFLPYSSEVEEATVGSQVLVVWWGSMSNAKVYYYANGYRGVSGTLATMPIGYIYISTASTNPGTLFGGTWSPIGEGRVLLSAGTTYTAGSTGGATTHKHTTGGHTLTTSEIPSHQHGTNSDSHTTFVLARGGDTHAVERKGFQTGSTNYAYANTLSTDGNLSRLGLTGSTGGGGSHSHGDTGSGSTMQPYLAVYMWERIA
jgi:microcystin-dependent protein